MSEQLILDISPAPPCSLENFIAGENKAALEALYQCVPGRAIYLWGAPGVGRTHLLLAMAGKDHTCYFNAEDPPARIHRIATDDNMPYRLIAIDDIDLFSKNGQAAVFALYNRWRATATTAGHFALVVAGNRAPLSLSIREDLRTRLGWDLVFRLVHLSDKHRAEAMQQRARERGLQLQTEVVNWILTHYARDMNRLTALVDALDTYSLVKKRPITLPLLKELLAYSQPSEP
ncbi:DnaA regulatory inactivator Hda [Alcaligenes endophyticus]|uniref:DnaA regulatory inactivator Hda n=1 Tax=Alcaligenes endophyticus TaxID=1929088 RepID=A0ABT8EMQ5_9BURK|nr:DnaA regulatory inactivator Hda [Alcaligenes endophyticus]MCX5591535.1 DnaA regulatory inactivator Hda [Alcaligenes endophyticus]MDN4122584.1 DnaA regulatory inactivator Hda [Alcaligenes endophyticus]